MVCLVSVQGLDCDSVTFDKSVTCEFNKDLEYFCPLIDGYIDPISELHLNNPCNYNCNFTDLSTCVEFADKFSNMYFDSEPYFFTATVFYITNQNMQTSTQLSLNILNNCSCKAYSAQENKKACESTPSNYHLMQVAAFFSKSNCEDDLSESAKNIYRAVIFRASSSDDNNSFSTDEIISLTVGLGVGIPFLVLLTYYGYKRRSKNTSSDVGVENLM